MASVNAARSTAAAADAGTAYDIAALIRGYRDRVRAYMARQIRSDADTLDDLEQETWIRVYASLHRFTGQSLVGTWVIGVARHVAADERRRRRRFERARAAFARERGAMVAAQLDHDHGVGEAAGRLRGVIQVLAPRERAVISAWAEGNRPRDIAVQLGITPGACRKALATAKARLRQMVVRRQGERSCGRIGAGNEDRRLW